MQSCLLSGAMHLAAKVPCTLPDLISTYTHAVYTQSSPHSMEVGEIGGRCAESQTWSVFVDFNKYPIRLGNTHARSERHARVNRATFSVNPSGSAHFAQILFQLRRTPDWPPVRPPLMLTEYQFPIRLIWKSVSKPMAGRHQQRTLP